MVQVSNWTGLPPNALLPSWPDSHDGQLVEIIELGKHPWFIGCQFHPELQSRPTRPHPLFAGFIAAAASPQAVSETSS